MMNFLINRKTLALATMILVVTTVPNSASARASIHLDLPHFSIGVHDNHRGKRYRQQRRHQRHHRQHRQHRQHERYNDRHYDRGYDRSYNRRGNDYYGGYGYSAPRSRQNSSRYNDDYCPTPGYSSRYYRNQGCYAHGDHYHCE